jgi:transglutaminase-like putative cysteine protease
VLLAPEARQHRHSDYFGTEVVEFEIAKPHRELTIDVRARVATTPPPPPPESSWQALRDPAYVEAAGEFLLAGDEAVQHPLLDELGEVARGAPTPLAALVALSREIPQRFEYRRGATYVDSSIQELLEGGAGVCQDFVHLALTLLRDAGIAARYVSGYLYADGGDESRESVEVDTHAWLEALLAPADGGEPVWVGADPTNQCLVGERHVKIGHGRRYPDVPPIKGVYRGGARSRLTASVTMTRLDGIDPASIPRS